ncbi:MAG: glycosyltransferase family 9 protein [Candidatus Hydrogenedentes bacterium]|nr:glycosyltransferase family 9 protein [Candidatus Hydrogenedentota bacterium]
MSRPASGPHVARSRPNRALRTLTWVIAHLPGGVHPTPAQDPRSILVYRMGNLGDIVVALPAFHALRDRYPKARMMLVTSPTKRGAPGAVEVLAKDDTFNEMIVYYEDESSSPAFLRKLRRQIIAAKVDFAILLPDDLSTAKSLAKQMAILAASGVRRIIGAEVVDHKDFAKGQVPRLMELIRPLGCSEVESFPWIKADQSDAARIAALLPPGQGPLIGMQCGAKRPANRWMPERFIALGQALVSELDARLIFTGSEGEKPLIESIIQGIGPGCTNLVGQTTIPELAALANLCDCFVSNDTGTMHVVASTGKPVVAIFSARDHAHRWYPYGEQHIVLRHNPECSPCLQDTCPLYDAPICLTAHEVAHVLAAVREVLAR